MYQVGDILVSDEIARELFVCDIERCKGACCVEGDAGAPLEAEEVEILMQIFEQVDKYLTPVAREVIATEGFAVQNEEGEWATHTINGRECVFAYYDTRGKLHCSIETAYRAGVLVRDFPKPISCHLYPIRVQKLWEGEAINYHRWSICSPACGLGKSLGVPLYQFLREPLVRKYGADWYAELVRQIGVQELS